MVKLKQVSVEITGQFIGYNDKDIDSFVVFDMSLGKVVGIGPDFAVWDTVLQTKAYGKGIVQDPKGYKKWTDKVHKKYGPKAPIV